MLGEWVFFCCVFVNSNSGSWQCQTFKRCKWKALIRPAAAVPWNEFLLLWLHSWMSFTCRPHSQSAATVAKITLRLSELPHTSLKNIVYLGIYNVSVFVLFCFPILGNGVKCASFICKHVQGSGKQPVCPNGLLSVKGNFDLTDADGEKNPLALTNFIVELNLHTPFLWLHFGLTAVPRTFRHI